MDHDKTRDSLDLVIDIAQNVIKDNPLLRSLVVNNLSAIRDSFAEHGKVIDNYAETQLARQKLLTTMLKYRGLPVVSLGENVVQRWQRLR